MLFLLLSILHYALAAGCHPQCRWACDDPVCAAVCHPVCQAPVCEFNQTCGSSPACHVRCPQDMCESDACPACETVCAEPPSEECGVIFCEATDCAWRCGKPVNCPHPRCELQCEQPACQYASAALLAPTLLAVVAALLASY